MRGFVWLKGRRSPAAFMAEISFPVLAPNIYVAYENEAHDDEKYFEPSTEKC